MGAEEDGVRGELAPIFSHLPRFPVEEKGDRPVEECDVEDTTPPHRGVVEVAGRAIFAETELPLEMLLACEPIDGETQGLARRLIGRQGRPIAQAMLERLVGRTTYEKSRGLLPGDVAGDVLPPGLVLADGER
jgi:hypothetical protein